MRRRIVLRTIGWLGALAIAGQVAAYTWLARQDIGGTSRRVWGVRMERGRFRVHYPNTWRVSSISRSPSFRILLEGPGGVRVDISGSSVLLPSAAGTEEMDGSRLTKLHAALATRSSIGIGSYREDSAEPSASLGRPSLVSSFSGTSAGPSVRGFRYTMEGSTRVWAIVAVAPESRWRRALPVMRSLAASVEVP